MSIEVYNLRRAREVYHRHGFSKEHMFRAIKIGPEYYSNKILRGVHYISSATIPGVTIENIEIPFMGSVLVEPSQMRWENTWTTTFKTPADFLVRNTIEEWMFDVRNPLTGKGSSCHNSQDSVIEIGVTNDEGQIIRCYTLYGVFPSSLGDIQYSMEGRELTNFDVTWSYQYWTPSRCDADLLNLVNNVSTEVGVVATKDIYQDYETFISSNNGKSLNDCSK
jgi:hypothetical protein